MFKIETADLWNAVTITVLAAVMYLLMNGLL